MFFIQCKLLDKIQNINLTHLPVVIPLSYSLKRHESRLVHRNGVFVSAPGQFVSRALQIPICRPICIPETVHSLKLMFKVSRHARTQARRRLLH